MSTTVPDPGVIVPAPRPLARETREEALVRMESVGLIDPSCAGCRSYYYESSPEVMPYDVFAPSHRASNRCESGKRAHCTCDTCF